MRASSIARASAYAEMSVVVDGAEESFEVFYDETLMRARVEEIREDAESDGYRTEVYILWHEHEPRECECAQYVTDHKPAYVFPEDVSDES